MGTSILQVKGLTKKYKRFTFGPLDLNVEEGMVVGLIGANGSGKSTLFRLLMNIIHADHGNVQVFGQKWNESDADWKKKVGYAGELLDAYHFLTISELKNLISRWYPTWNENQFIELIKRYHIDIEEKYGKCSKGTKKKVEFIFSLCHDPSLLLLDEPTAGVDIVSQKKMKEDCITFMEKEGKTIVLATHTVDEINQLCDEILVLDAGRLLTSFNKDEIYDHWARIWISHLTDTVSNHPNVVVSESEPAQMVTNDFQTVEAFLQEEKIEIHHVQRLSIEDVLEYLIKE